MTAKPAALVLQRFLWIALALFAALGGAAILAPRRQGTPAASQAASVPPEVREATRLREQIRTTPGNPSPRLALAGLFLDRGRNYDAYDVALEARRAFPDSAAVARQLAEAQFRTARQPAAVETLRPLARGTLVDRLQLAGYLVRMGRREEAVRLLEQASPDLSPPDAVRAGMLCMEAMRPESAVGLLRPAARRNPDVTELQTLYGLALILAGRYSEAAQVLDAALRQAPGLATLQFYAGAALRLSGDRERLLQAESYLRAAAETEPDNGLFQYELALCRMHLRDWNGARAPLEGAASLLPDTPEIHRDLASLYEKLRLPRAASMVWAHYYRTVNDPAASVRKLRPLLAKDPSDVDAGLLLASAEYAARTGPDAAALLNSLRKREPRRAEVLRAQLSLLKSTRRWKEARGVVDALERLTPGDPAVETERADVDHNLGEFAEEEKALLRLCDRDPYNPEHHYNLAQFLIRSSQRPDRFRAAEASLRKALELRSDYAAARLALGSVLETTRRPAEAIPELRTALDAAPEDRDALRALGRAYLKVGDRARSDEIFRLLKRFQARADKETRLESQMDQFVGREATPGYLVYLRQRRKTLVRFRLETGSLASATMELEMLAHASPDDMEVHRLLERLCGRARRFQRQFEERRLLNGKASPREARPRT